MSNAEAAVLENLYTGKLEFPQLTGGLLVPI